MPEDNITVSRAQLVKAFELWSASATDGDWKGPEVPERQADALIEFVAKVQAEAT